MSFTCSGTPSTECPLLVASSTDVLSTGFRDCKVYWSEHLALATTATSGGAARFLARRVDVLSDASYGFRSVATDARDVYWVDMGTGSASQGTPPPGKQCYGGTPPCFWNLDDGAVIKVSRDGGEPVPLVCGLKMPDGLAIDSAYVYWTDSGGAGGMRRLMKVSLDGGQPTVLAENDAIRGGLVLDGARVYWWDGHGISSMSTNGGPVIPLVDGKILSEFKFSNGAVYYWEAIATDAGQPTLGALMRLPLTGGSAVTLATTDDRAALTTGMSCVPDGNSVYWLVSGAIKRTSTDGSVTTTVASVVDAVRLVSTDATAVYYTTYSSLMAIPK